MRFRYLVFSFIFTSTLLGFISYKAIESLYQNECYAVVFDHKDMSTDSPSAVFSESEYFDYGLSLDYFDEHYPVDFKTTESIKTKVQLVEYKMNQQKFSLRNHFIKLSKNKKSTVKKSELKFNKNVKPTKSVYFLLGEKIAGKIDYSEKVEHKGFQLSQPITSFAFASLLKKVKHEIALLDKPAPKDNTKTVLLVKNNNKQVEKRKKLNPVVKPEPVRVLAKPVISKVQVTPKLIEVSADSKLYKDKKEKSKKQHQVVTQQVEEKVSSVVRENPVTEKTGVSKDSARKIIDETIARFNHDKNIGLYSVGQNAEDKKNDSVKQVNNLVTTQLKPEKNKGNGARVDTQSGHTLKVASHFDKLNRVKHPVKKEPALEKSAFNSSSNNDENYSCDYTYNRKTFDSELNIFLNSIAGEGMISELEYFQAQYIDTGDLNESEQGSLSISAVLSKNLAVRSVLFSSPQHIDMRTDLMIEATSPNEVIDYQLPIVKRDYFYHLLEKFKISEYSASLLVEIDNEHEKRKYQTDFVEVDDQNAVVMYFDESFQPVNNNTQDDYKYILFLGLNTGNANVRFHDLSGNWTQKTIFLREGELFFERNEFVRLFNEKTSVCQNWLTGSKASAFPLNRHKIYWDSNNKDISSIGINTFKQDFQLLTLGQKRYIHFEKSNMSIGYWDNKKLFVPSKEYKTFVLNQFELDRLDETRCMIQVNLDRVGLSNLRVTNFNARKDGSTELSENEILFLDEDGTIHQEPGEKTTKVFILGYGQGTANIYLENMDLSENFMKSYCNPGSYIVEQL